MSIYKQLSKSPQPATPVDDGLEEYFSDDDELKNARSSSKSSANETLVTKSNSTG